jgi:uncharacterized protein GlcG (DUF336 family)
MYLNKFYVAMIFSVLLSADLCRAQDCSKVPNYEKLKAAMTSAVKQGQGGNGGLGNQEWGTVVNRDGVVCALVFTGPERGSQWPGSRIISAMKANTANAFSIDNFALSSGNIYSSAQPGGSLYGITLQSNPAVVLVGDPQKFGQKDDPMVGKAPGGVIVFAGGLALYSKDGKIVGGLGASGDTACADHVIAWRARHELGLDNVPMGVAPGPSDNLIFDIQDGQSPSGYGHPSCKGGKPSEEIIKDLTNKIPSGPHH